jgi:hypothetical protein
MRENAWQRSPGIHACGCKSGVMMKRSIRLIALGAGAAVTAIGGLFAPSAAHHSTAMFEWGTVSKIDRVTVERWVWTNPHTFLYVKDGKGERWAFEGMSPNHLSRSGWSKRSLAPGEVIDLTYYALRDKRKGGFNVSVIKKDGSKLEQLPQRQ